VLQTVVHSNGLLETCRSGWSYSSVGLRFHCEDMEERLRVEHHKTRDPNWRWESQKDGVSMSLFPPEKARWGAQRTSFKLRRRSIFRRIKSWRFSLHGRGKDKTLIESSGYGTARRGESPLSKTSMTS